MPGERTDPSNSSACMECPQNTYNDVAGGDCKNCSAGSITLDTGMRSSGDCIGMFYIQCYLPLPGNISPSTYLNFLLAA